MNEQPWLVTTCFFKGNQFLVKMSSNRGNYLELSVVDKHSGEEWSSKYDSKFIENLTFKTGNYKRFDIFITMLKSGLLRTSECVSLDLLTYEDLELLRGKRKDKTGCKLNSPPPSRGSAIASTNRRYLILTYTVEFDRIHYPLPMEYIGPPNPRILQSTIKKLEAEVQKLKSKLNDGKDSSYVEHWKERVKHLEADNWILQEEVAHLRQLLTKQTGTRASVPPGDIPVALQSLEEQVKRERASFRATVHGLQEQNYRLRQEKSEPIQTLWKQSPVNYQRVTSPTPNGGIDNNQHHIPSSKPQHRNEVWRARLNKHNFEAGKPDGIASERKSRMTCANKHKMDNCKHIVSAVYVVPTDVLLLILLLADSDIHSRSKSSGIVRHRPHRVEGPQFQSRTWKSQRPVASSCERTSSSSECSSIRGQSRIKKPKSKHSRTSSQASSCSVSSSLTSTSISNRGRVFRRNAHGDADYVNPMKISNSTGKRIQPPHTSRQTQHGKDLRKPSRRAPDISGGPPPPGILISV
ncbi:centrosomal protein CCDC61-like [Hetaerina americana]|uniref:centrosomal protein CCDC61-like n=1 Tax=Hetaerina americana TaxID=62018 RepID=UPI003A7F61FE